MPPLPGQEEPIRRITKIVDWLITRQDLTPFREPVDWRGLELFDYPQIITKMMDLGTIKRRLERGQYLTTHQVAEDVRLVWKNCMTYNADGSDFWLLAKSYARRFEDRYRKIRQEFDCGEELDQSTTKETASTRSSGRTSTSGNNADANSATRTPKSAASSSSPRDETPSPVSTPMSIAAAPPPSLDARARFGSNLFLLSGTELGYVISTCELECPSSIELPYGSYDAAKIEINVDEIPNDVFAQLNTYVSSKVGQRSLSDSPVDEKSATTASGGGSSRAKKKQRK